ncbi:MAG: hypothetical protein LBS69_11420 [Prevotellaceae bacterium]|jgi:hypothetical protein|nr:hypothetical protein [Prevotellaceae bacterium]
MKKVLLIIAFIGCLNAQGQNTKKLSDYFPDLQNVNTITTNRQLMKMLYSSESGKNILDTIVALHYFFDDNVEIMHDVFEGYNSDENTYTYTPYTKEVCPLYKKIFNKNIFLLCYSIESIMYIAIYNYQDDKIKNTLVILDDSNEADVFTWSTIFPNNYIVTVQSIDKTYYILSKIDYDSQKFIELKKIEADSNQSYYSIMNDAFETLGISETGELLEEKQ